MGRIRDLTGQVFREITFISYQGKTSYGHALWLCKCHCGKQFITVGAQVTNTSGTTKGCGCVRKIGIIKHGDAGTPFYKCWVDMLHRCNSIKNKHYHNYGGRGIKVCERWFDYLNFKEDMFSSFKTGLSLDRTENSGNYEKSNCRWITMKQQHANTRRNVYIETPNGKITLIELSRKIGINYSTLSFRRRYNKNIPYEELTALLHQGNHKR